MEQVPQQLVYDVLIQVVDEGALRRTVIANDCEYWQYGELPAVVTVVGFRME
jgi:hypothetical protein